MNRGDIDWYENMKVSLSKRTFKKMIEISFFFHVFIFMKKTRGKNLILLILDLIFSTKFSKPKIFFENLNEILHMFLPMKKKTCGKNLFNFLF